MDFKKIVNCDILVRELVDCNKSCNMIGSLSESFPTKADICFSTSQARAFD